jgi:uncharacterized Fe-S radical SAM superfamily protein PflX
MKPKIYQCFDDSELIYAVFPDGKVYYNQITSWCPSQLGKDTDANLWFESRPEYHPVAFRDIKIMLTPNHSLKKLKQLHAEHVGMKSALSSAAQV